MFSSPLAGGASDTGGKTEVADAYVGEFTYHNVYHALVADSEKAREETSLVGGKDNTEKFGPLKSVLGNVPALYANCEVCLQPPTQILHK